MSYLDIQQINEYSTKFESIIYTIRRRRVNKIPIEHDIEYNQNTFPRTPYTGRHLGRQSRPELYTYALV